VPFDLRAYLINSPGRRGKTTMSSAGDARDVEREQLKFALVTFALQLDAFEVQAKEALQPLSKAADKLGHPRKDPQIASP
jgi:hypothetical protein